MRLPAVALLVIGTISLVSCGRDSSPTEPLLMPLPSFALEPVDCATQNIPIDECNAYVTRAETIDATIETLREGQTISHGDATSLTSLLQRALDRFLDGHPTGAQGPLHAFRIQVEQLVDRGVLAPEQGQGLLDDVQHLEDAAHEIFNVVCGAEADFDNGAIPAGWSAGIIRGGPGLVNDRLEGREIDGGGEVGALLGTGFGASEIMIEYRGNLDPVYWGMWDGISLPTTDGRTWLLTSATGGYGAGLYPPGYFRGATLDGTGSYLGVLGGPLSNQVIHFNDPLIPEFGVFRYQVWLTDDGVQWTLYRDADGSLVVHHTATLTGFRPSDVMGFAIHAYTTSGSPTPPSVHWIDDLKVTCGQ